MYNCDLIKMKGLHEKYLLIPIYLTIVSVTAFRIAVHPSNYTTPDSAAYLNQADLIKSNWQSSISVGDLFDIKGSFTIWAIGYPTTIAATSLLTGLPTLFASKVVNFVFLGLFFLLLWKMFGDKAWFTTLPFLSYGSLEVIAETWSELPFVFFAFLLCFLVLHEKQMQLWSLCLSLTVCLVLLFLMRYVGVIYFFILAGFLVKHFLAKNYQLALGYFIPLFLSSTFVLWYFHDNQIVSGYSSGMPRLAVGHKGFWLFVLELVQGLFNEFSISRNHFFRGMPDLLFIGLTLIQLGVLFILAKGRKLLSYPVIVTEQVKKLLLFAAGYLVGIILFKVFIPIDAFDFRILFPFSAVFFIGIFAIVVDESQKAFYKKYSRYIIGFMLLSFIINLPKNYILETIRQLFG